VPFHKAFGWIWLGAILMVSLSSFWIRGNFNWPFGYGPIHLLSLWVIVCVYKSITSIRNGNIKRHKGFLIGAYFGSIGAGIAAILLPGRFLHGVLF